MVNIIYNLRGDSMNLYKWWSIFVNIILIILLANIVTEIIDNRKLDIINAIYGVIILICIVVNLYTSIKKGMIKKS